MLASVTTIFTAPGVLARELRSKTRTDAAEQRSMVEGDFGRRRLRGVFIERANEIHIVSAQYRY
jgi:uncharacterized DUF497 family protein